MDSNKITRKFQIIRKNFTVWLNWSVSMFMKVLYHGGIPLSFLYGK